MDKNKSFGREKIVSASSLWARTLKRVLALAATLICTHVPSSFADGIYQWEEYGSFVTSAQRISALSDEAYGDNVSLFTGSVTFSVTDISVPGNSKLPVAFGRRFAVESRNQGRPNDVKGSNLEGFFDWDVDVPYLEGMFSEQYGWQTRQGDSGTLNRCSVTGRPYVGTVTSADKVWSGYNVHVPGGADGKLLVATAGAYSSPTDGYTYPWVTKSNWRFRCLGTTANGYPGQGFLGVAPDGTRYYFNWGIEREAAMLKVPEARPASFVRRKRVFLLATRIEDRFGNWVNYSYTGDRLTSITANDGRSITVNWTNDRITSASTNGRTWQYLYQENVTGKDGGLSAVILPDGSQWSYVKTGRLWTRNIPNFPEGEECEVYEYGSYGPFSYSVTHPSGAIAQFNFTQKLIFRSTTPSPCSGGVEPGFYDVWGLDTKTVSGPGVAAQTTSYSVAQGPVGSDKHKWTTVTRPDGTRLRFKHGTDYYSNEGKLLQEQTLTASGTIVKDRSITYVSDAEVGPFPSSIGSTHHMWQADEGKIRPIKSVSVALDGETFTTTVNSFDVMARPLSVTRSSTLGYSRTDVTSYQDNTAKWVLGLVASVTNTNTGLVQSETTYHPTDAVPTDFYVFGKKEQTLTYHSDGTVHTVKDGANKTTTLTSWKRGIPRSILFADGTTQSAVVNDEGWITSITDQNNFVTSYGYDSMGRLASITYPTADDVVWNSSTQSFQRVGSAEYGIPAGHWRLTESTGNARKITYFDALWRPLVTTEYDTADVGATRRFQRFRYDYANRVTFASYPGTTDALTTGTHTAYDALGRTMSVTQDSELGSLATVTEYLSGLRVRVTNPRGYSTLTGFQAYDEPSYDLPVSIQHPEGAYTDIDRDVFGKPKSITRRDASGAKSVTRRYVYDAQQRLCKTIEPETGALVVDYDAAGNVAWSAGGLNLPSISNCDRSTAESSGRKVGRTYDALNRVQTITFPDSNGNQVWTYTPDGLADTITTRNDGGASTVTNRYEYNKRRLLKKEILTHADGSAWTISYGYNANGHASTITYPSLLTVDYAPNALGQATKAGNYASGVSYYPNGAIYQFTYGNGITHTMTQNARQLPERLVDSGNVLDNTYSYDENANVQSIGDAIPGNYARTMSYDGLDRLTDAISAGFGGNGHMRYEYDELDNLTSAKLSGVKQYNYVYQPGTNRLTGITNDSGNSLFGLSYDAQGNVSSKNAQGFTFDFGNRMRGTELNGVVVERYRYDGHGRRVNAWSPDQGQILSMYGSDGVLRRQLDERAAKAVEYVYLGGSLIARVSTNVAPGAPSLSTNPAGYVAGGNYVVQWTPRAGATSYELRERLNSNSWQSAYSGSETSRSMSSKPSGAYSYQVRACSTLGCSAWSDTVLITVARPPSSAPTITVPATSNNGSYAVSWTSVGDAQSYTLEESANGGGSWTSAYSGTGQSKSFSSKAEGTYTYRVKACNTDGCGPSSTGAIQVIYIPSGSPTLTAPSVDTDGSYTVSWTTVTFATAYRLEEKVGSGSWTQVQNSSATSRNFSGKSAAIYSYRVRGCTSGGCGPYSATVTTEVSFPPTTAPTISAPSSNYTGSYSVTWTSVGSVTSYKLEESVNGGSWTQIQSSASTSRAISGKGSGTYKYRVRGCNAGGCGPYSSAVTTVVTLPPSAAPTLTVPSSSTSGSYTVSWTSVTGATSYRLEERENGGTWTQIQNASSTSRAISGKWSADFGYRVRACNAGGCGPYSAIKTIVVALGPPKPASFSVTYTYTAGKYKFTATWSSSSGATSYQLQGRSYTGSNTSVTWTLPADSADFSIEYYVRACNANGCSAWVGPRTAQ